ncbi:MAG: N-acetyltransferase [Candidatus Zixiibacteriota bacterium]|nr:MAG: N-acetyltransferase [candidate division Zixibacteria bacterium]
MDEPDASTSRVVFTTERLIVRLATTSDVDLYYHFWTDPRVMTNVGFPKGLPFTREKIIDRLARAGASEFDHLLIVELKANYQAIGECKMSTPNSDGVATTDVKLLPETWGNGYGVEIKRGLLNHLFANTDCIAAEATPNVNNVASIKMQEAVGGIRVGENTDYFPETMRSYTTPVHHYIYRVSRTDWQKQQRT